METSILTSVKKVLGLTEADESFDIDVIMHINTMLRVVKDLGVGETAFRIEDKTATWDEFLGSDPRFDDVQTYIYLRVRLIFDPPQTAHALAAIKEQYKELEWRINVEREGTAWTLPSVGP